MMRDAKLPEAEFSSEDLVKAVVSLEKLGLQRFVTFKYRRLSGALSRSSSENSDKEAAQKSIVTNQKYAALCAQAREQLEGRGLQAGKSSSSWQKAYLEAGIPIDLVTSTPSGQKLKRLSLLRDDYPPLLRNIGDPPPFLYCLGDTGLLSRKLVSIVGSRKLSSGSFPECERLLLACKQKGLVTVSGLAYGVDALVHKRSLDIGIPTIAVLPSSIGDISPRAHIGLAADILANGGLLISEHIWPQDKASKYIFPRRNRIIAALSLATVVLQAGLPSGAIITAKQAYSYERAVFASAIQPTSPHYLGNQKLLDTQVAQPLTLEMSQLWNALSIETKPGKIQAESSYEALGLSGEELQIMRALLSGADNPDSLASALAESGKAIDAGVMMQLLGKLELEGRVGRDNYGRIKIL